MLAHSIAKFLPIFLYQKVTNECQQYNFKYLLKYNKRMLCYQYIHNIIIFNYYY